MAAFVQTGDFAWSNLSRATAIEVKPSDRVAGTWFVQAHFSGAHPVIRDGFPNSQAAREWVADLLEGSL